MNLVSSQTDGAVNEGSKSGIQSTTAATTDESTDNGVDVADLANGTLPRENVNGIAAKSSTLEEISALDGKKVSLDAVHGNDSVDAQNALSNSGESEHLHEDPTRSDVEVTAEVDDKADAAENSGQYEREPVPDDDDDDEGGRRDSEIFEEPVANSAQAAARPKRYELSYWPEHLSSAEKLWTTEEREKSDDWKELWKLVIQFLCESPDVFKIWQQHYMQLDEDFEADNTPLSPLQIAAAYSIRGLVKILLDRGEPAAAESEDGRSALWFAAHSLDIEIISLLLAGGASPNAHKDFPPPFHRLIWRNPKLEFVELMLKRGADCSIMDQWGFNVMHWFAIFGSDVEVLKDLLEAHGDINVPDSIGETPLHKLMYNVRGLSLDLLRGFLESGADVNKDDKDSQSESPQLTPSLPYIDHLQGHCTRSAPSEIHRRPRCCLTMELTFMMTM